MPRGFAARWASVSVPLLEQLLLLLSHEVTSDSLRQRDLLFLHLGEVAGVSLKPIFKPQEGSVSFFGSLTKSVFGRTLQVVSVLLFS